jgi:hypothetical protein
MHIIESMRRYWLLSICFFVLALMLMACGGAASASSSSGSTSNGNTGSSTTSNSGSTNNNTGTTAVNGYGTANGCPSNAIESAGSKANVVVKVAQMNQTIPVRNGDVIEVQLPFGHRWTGPTTSQGILQIQGPAGYASQSAGACIWRFVAKGTGAAQLVFHSQALCQGGQVCPMYITSMPFEFNVK